MSFTKNKTKQNKTTSLCMLEKNPWSHISLFPVKEKRGREFFKREHSRLAQQLFWSLSQVMFPEISSKEN